MDFCLAHPERQWALIVGTFHFGLGSPWLKKPSSCCCTDSMLGVFSDLTTTGGKVRCQRHLYHVLCTLDFQIKHVRAFLVQSCQHAIFHLDEKSSHSIWKATQTVEQWAIINDQKHWSFGSASRSGCGTVSLHRGLKDFEFQTGNSLITLQKWSCEVWS